MKSLTQAGVFSFGRWGRWAMVSLLAAAEAGCGGGSDPLNLEGGSSSDGGGSSVDLRAAYDRIACGMTLQQAENAVGRKIDLGGSGTWWWQAEYWTPSTEELGVGYAVAEGTGVQTASSARYEHPKQGITLERDLCE